MEPEDAIDELATMAAADMARRWRAAAFMAGLADAAGEAQLAAGYALEVISLVAFALPEERTW